MMTQLVKVPFSQIIVVRIVITPADLTKSLLLGNRFWTDTNKLFLDREYDGVFGPTKKGVPRST